MNFNIIDRPNEKIIVGKDFHSLFKKDTGLTLTWGETYEDDPDYCPIGPTLLDIEISSANSNDISNSSPLNIVSEGGCNGVGCKKFCYKGNTGDKSVHMSIEMFRQIADKLITKVELTLENIHTLEIRSISCMAHEVFVLDDNQLVKAHRLKAGHRIEIWDDNLNSDFYIVKEIKHLYTTCQIAFGICDLNGNPDLWKILEETRNRGIVPNITINGIGLTDEQAKKLSKYCGAIAVSINPYNKEQAYNAVKMLSQDYGMSQINFHIVLAKETVSFIQSVVTDIKRDNRLSKLNAVVMLSFKDKTHTKCFTPIT